ncbi:MAG: LacI family DNA-binding transcriptional regulator [Bryobacteraceae bacterium]
MATIYDVARRAGVSTFTVSAVLNQSARVSPELTQRVLRAARKLDYTISFVARSLQTRRTMTVGMLIPDIGNPWFAKVVRGVEDVCRQRQYSVFIGNTYDQPEIQERYLTVFRSRRVDGMLVFLAPGSEQQLAPVVKKGPPVVFVGRRPRSFAADSVSANNRLGTRLAVEHLISRGHRRIAIITGPLSLSAGRDRVTGWREGLKRAGLPAPLAYRREADWTAESARRHTHELLSLPEPPTAIFAANFLMMTGVLAALRERGLRVPDQVEVMSSDDSEWLDVFEPRISVVLQPSYEMGETAARLLLERIENPEAPPRRVLLKPSLKLR